MFTNVLETFGTLLENCIKVLKVDLINDTYDVIKIHSGEKEPVEKNSFSRWMLKFAEDGNVYLEDLEFYKFNTRLAHIRDYFSESTHSSMTIRYRRKVDTKFRWVSLELLRAKDYSSTNQIVFLIIRDIHESYTNELELQSKLEHYCNYDTLTELKNFHSYKDLCDKYLLGSARSIGVIFSDVNGLKVINDTQGHEAGNNVLCSYSILLTDLFKDYFVFRISGDEFVVVFFDIKQMEMEYMADRLVKAVTKYEFPIASVGFAWNESPESIESVAKIAEANMYMDKQAFYKKYPEYRRDKSDLLVPSSEIEAALSTLSQLYPTVGIINMTDDTYKMIRMDAVIGEPIIKPTYTDYVNEFVNNHVCKESYLVLKDMLGVTKLSKALEGEQSITLTFRTKDSHWRQITFHVMERVGNEIRKVVFFAYEMNQYSKDVFDRIYNDNKR